MAGFLPHIPFYCIHLEREEGRLDLMKSLEEGLGHPLVLWNASEGADVAKFSWPRRHPWEGEIKEGELGCLASHVRLLGLMHSNIIGVFEDDAELVCSLETLQKYVATVEEIMPDWDIILLGGNEWVESLPFARIATKPHYDDVRRIQRFWGTHAFLIKRRAAELVVTTHHAVMSQGFTYPADWLYAKTIKDYNLRVYGPSDPKSMIRQKPGLVSSITGNIRT
jgi:GR25 family glycosyltransferase involved in LPS biosynthesis